MLIISHACYLGENLFEFVFSRSEFNFVPVIFSFCNTVLRAFVTGLIEFQLWVGAYLETGVGSLRRTEYGGGGLQWGIMLKIPHSKLMVPIFKALFGLGPAYLWGHLSPYLPHRTVHSAEQHPGLKDIKLTSIRARVFYPGLNLVV